jgi:hypothetical protein
VPTPSEDAAVPENLAAELDKPASPQPAGVGPPEDVAAESTDLAELLCDDGTLKP